MDPQGHRLKRRQFLANLLFAGGALTLGGLQSAQAQEDPTEGWSLPDLQDPPKDDKPPGNPPPPQPPPPPTAGVPLPQPPGERPPNIMGLRAIPKEPPRKPEQK